jgi:hypothetical protein
MKTYENKDWLQAKADAQKLFLAGYDPVLIRFPTGEYMLFDSKREYWEWAANNIGARYSVCGV